MPFVLLRISEEFAESSAFNAIDPIMDVIAQAIADNLPGELDPIEDIEFTDIQVRHAKARSKYDMSIFIEAARTEERVKIGEQVLIDAITQQIDEKLMSMPKFNVWLKLVRAGYAHN